MGRILFATWDGGGNLPPAVGIAVALAERGHDVRILGHASQRCAVEDHGVAFGAYTGDWSPDRGADVLSIVFDRTIGAEVVAAARARDAGLVVVDSMLAGVADAVHRARLTWAVLHHTLYLTGLQGPRVFGAIARLRGMRGGWDAADAVIVPTLRALEPRAGEPPSNVHHTGPVWQDHPPVAAGPADPPLVLVSLSTNDFRGQRETLQTVLDAVDGLRVHAFVTTGPAVDPARLSPPANAELHRYVPHGRVLPRASLVVGHGGHCTTMRALAHDLPVIVVPSMASTDQPHVGRAVQAAGAGIALRRGSSAARVRAAVERALGDPSVRAAAAGLGAAIRSRDGAVVAADRLEALLALRGR